MIAHKPVKLRGVQPGVCWPDSGGYDVGTVGDVFGGRPFAAHSSGYDFHRGVDLLDGLDGSGEPAGSGGRPVYAPICGTVIRKHYGFFSWYDAGNMTECQEVDASSKATFSASAGTLTVVGKNDGTVTVATGFARLEKIAPHQLVTGNDWWSQIELSSVPAGAWTGELVLGVIDQANNEYFCMTYDGSSFRAYQKDSGGIRGLDTGVATPSARKFFRIGEVSGSTYWYHSTDGTTWTNLGGFAWAPTDRTKWKMFIGWKPAAAGGDTTVAVKHWGGGDSSSINRFGNWVEIANASSKWVLMHMRHISVALGQYVEAGVEIGITGKTGFDTLSGPIIQNHLHVEYVPNNKHDYDNSESYNPLAASLLPRASTTPSVSVVRDTAVDPETGAATCHRLTVTVTRGSYQNFQINEFNLTGNTAARTCNWNTRAGLNPSDHDDISYDGLFFEAAEFDEATSTYVFKIYANQATVGASWVSGYVKDSDGNTVWSG